ncbi:MAG: hypothetical protein ACQZ2J_01975 [Pseudomonas piscis]|uniref:hypothetical protein n=1 Tax=Pseudomonas piscis TaxID=2614538 RepID=UPI003D2BD0EC
MTNVVARTDGQPVTVTFNIGLPGPCDGPCIFLLDDGSIHAGEVVRNSQTFPTGALSTTNASGGIHEAFEIPLRRVIGWADSSPRDRNCYVKSAMTTTTATQKVALLNILRIKIDSIGKGESRFIDRREENARANAEALADANIITDDERDDVYEKAHAAAIAAVRAHI